MVSNGSRIGGRGFPGALHAWRPGLLAVVLLALLNACTLPHRPGSGDDGSPGACVRADIVAFEQAYVLNRFGAYVPAGLMYALRADVVPIAPEQGLVPGNVMLRQDKRPRPLVLRVNQGECLDVVLQNMLQRQWSEDGRPVHQVPAHVEAAAGMPSSRELVRASSMSIDAPATRAASFHVTGLELMPIAAQQCPVGAACGGDGSHAGQTRPGALVFHPDTPLAEQARFTKGSLAMPGQRVMTRWLAAKEGTYFAYSTAAPVGGEGDGGQIGLGLFAAVNVEPAGSLWLRSQITHAQMLKLRQGTPAGEHPGAQLRYFEEEEINGQRRPILHMLDAQRRIVHSDLNAIIVLPQGVRQRRRPRVRCAA